MQPRFLAGLGLVLIVAVSLFVLGGGQKPSVAEVDSSEAVLKTLDEATVRLYLHDGSDVVGRIKEVTTEVMLLDTGEKEPETVKRRSIQGLILDTPEEYAFAEEISRDPVLIVAAGQYISDLRERVNKNIRPVPCDTGLIPVLHARILPDGEMGKLVMLASSGCDELDRSVVEGFRKTRFKPFPEELALKIYPMNYYYEAAAVQK